MNKIILPEHLIFKILIFNSHKIADLIRPIVENYKKFEFRDKKSFSYYFLYCYDRYCFYCRGRLNIFRGAKFCLNCPGYDTVDNTKKIKDAKLKELFIERMINDKKYMKGYFHPENMSDVLNCHTFCFHVGLQPHNPGNSTSIILLK